MDDRVITDLHRRFGEIDRRSAKPRLGVVTDDVPLTVAMGGSTATYTGVKQIAGHDLKVGDTIVALVFGNDIFVLGRNGDSEPRVAYTFSNGWRNFGAGSAPYGNRNGFYKDAGGTVFLEGLIDKNGGNFVGAETMITLPVGYRPPNTRLCPVRVAGGGGGATEGMGRIDVTSAGLVVLQNGGAANPVYFLSLAGVNFRAA